LKYYLGTFEVTYTVSAPRPAYRSLRDRPTSAASKSTSVIESFGQIDVVIHNASRLAWRVHSAVVDCLVDVVPGELANNASPVGEVLTAGTVRFAGRRACGDGLGVQPISSEVGEC
jgi:hypothetical protein